MLYLLIIVAQDNGWRFPIKFKISYKTLLGFFDIRERSRDILLVGGLKNHTSSPDTHVTIRASPEGNFDVHIKDEKSGLYDTIVAGIFDPSEYLKLLIDSFEEVEDVKDEKYSNYDVCIIEDEEKLLKISKKFGRIKSNETSFNLSLMEESGIAKYIDEIENSVRVIPFSELESSFEGMIFVCNRDNERVMFPVFKLKDKIILYNPLNMIKQMVEKYSVELINCETCGKKHPPFFKKCPNCR